MKQRNVHEYTGKLSSAFFDELGGDGLIFQQDNASIHQSRYMKAWFADRNLSVIDWPANSPTKPD